MVGFACASVVGVAAGNLVSTTLWRAMGVMLVCWVVGRIIGVLLQRTVEDHVARHKQAHPLDAELSNTEEKPSHTQAAPGGDVPVAGSA